ncbi:tyrosine-type recombinase/integrase [bacterium]|nr:tyrosine-type recombinase/integrase [bacterium]
MSDSNPKPDPKLSKTEGNERMRSDIILHSVTDHSGKQDAVHVPAQADSDQHLIALWLHGRSAHTQRAYRRDALLFLSTSVKSIHGVTLSDLQTHADHLAETGLKQSSIHRKLSAIKSLISFGYRLGYLPFDVSKPFRLPPLKNELSSRILDEMDVLRMIALEKNRRNKAILLTLYAAGLRVSELCGITWSDLHIRDSAGQITVFGKGGKTRTVLIPQSVWQSLMSLRGDAKDDAPVFRSRKGGHLDQSQVWRIVRKAAKQAEIPKDVSCHWLRHAHASHALDRGAPIHLVQATLGHSSIATTGKYLHARPTESSGEFLPV